MYPDESLRWMLGKDIERSTPDDFTGTVLETVARVCRDWRVVSVGDFERQQPHPLPGHWQSFIMQKEHTSVWVVKPMFMTASSSVTNRVRSGWDNIDLTQRRERFTGSVPPYFATDMGLEGLLEELSDTVHATRDNGNVQADAAAAAVRGFLACDTSTDPELAGVQLLLALGGFNGLVNTVQKN